MNTAISTYAFPADPECRTNLAERTTVYGHVGNGSARDARVRAAALADRERTEVARSQHEHAGRISAFWLRSTPAA